MLETPTMVSVPDMCPWWLAFMVAAWLIPFVVVAYLCYPAKMRLKRVRDAACRTEKALKQRVDASNRDRGEVLKALEQYRQRMEALIEERFLAKTYILPLGFLVLVLNVGFFVAFSRIQPLVPGLPTSNILITRIEPGLLSGFFGGTLYALYSVVTRYRSQDIPPPLIFQLAYQIILASAIGYFAPTPWLAFAAGFVPYSELTSWLRHTAQTGFGATAGLERGTAEKGKPLWSQSLASLQGIAPLHRERLGEEGIVTIENLALANPLSLYLVTSYSMSQIIDWIDQAYLRLYVSGEAAVRLTARGVCGAIEVAEVAEQLEKMTSEEDRRALLDSLSGEVVRVAYPLLLEAIHDQLDVVDLGDGHWVSSGAPTKP